MAFFPLQIRPFKHPQHSSTCPLCKETDSQAGWVMGAPNLNLSILRASAILNNFLIEASFSYCPNCDFGYFFPVPPQELLDSFYSNGGGGGEKTPYEEVLASLNSFSATDTASTTFSTIFSMLAEDGIALESFAHKKVLEIGPGLGGLAQLFQKHEMEYWANEIGSEAVRYLETELKVPVIAYNLEDIPAEYDGGFDLIISKDSLEHHPNPLSSLARISKLLSAGGLLVITVPNLNSHSFQQFSVTHPYYAFPPHLNYFSSGSFQRSLSNLGLAEVKVRTFSFLSEIFYCMELGIKLGMIRPDEEFINKMSELGRHERLLVAARKMV